MKTQRWTIVLCLSAVIALLVRSGPALADAAPPQYPPGGDVGVGGFETQVQMVAEEVTITVEHVAGGTGIDNAYLAADKTRAHVDAVFIMLNTGSEVESFDVWFPLGANDGWGTEQTIQNFAAWVGDTPATTSQVSVEPANWEAPSRWATWPVTFYPGQAITLHVAYHMLPTGYSPYGRFEYLLQTGAGWEGPIGEGMVTVRLPYEVNEFNTVLAGGDWQSPSPAYYSVEGNEVVWTFTDLEPTREDNIGLTMLSPDIWQAIVEAEQVAAAQAQNAAAQHALAEARSAALYIRHGVEEIGRNEEMAMLALEAYQRTVELSPDNVEYYIGYLELLEAMWWRTAIPDEGAEALLVQTLNKALSLAPDDERLLRFKRNLGDYFTTPTPAATAVPTRTPQPSLSPVPAITATPVETVPTSTAIPTTAKPQPTPPPRGGIPCLSALVVLAPALVITLRRRRPSA